MRHVCFLSSGRLDFPLNISGLFTHVSSLVKDHRVGSEFWSLPQHYGDEMSGITATLTQTEQNQKKPVTYAGKPSSIQKELGKHALHMTPCFLKCVFIKKHNYYNASIQ